MIPEPTLSPIEQLGAELRQPEVLRAIVRGNSELVDLLVDAVTELHKAFGDRATIALEPFVDPEVADARPEIFAVA